MAEESKNKNIYTILKWPIIVVSIFFGLLLAKIFLGIEIQEIDLFGVKAKVGQDGTVVISDAPDSTEAVTDQIPDPKPDNTGISSKKETSKEKAKARPVLDLPLNEVNSNRVKDHSGNTLDGVLVQKVSLIEDDHFGKCLYFYDNGGYVRILHNDLIKPTDALTVSFWAKKEAWTATSTEKIISNTEGGGYAIARTDKGNITVFLRIGGSYRNVRYSTSNLTNGSWHHFAFTYDGAVLKFYVDGIIKDSHNITGSIQYNHDNATLIGAEASNRDHGAGEPFKGRIAKVKIYDTALPEDHIKDLAEK